MKKILNLVCECVCMLDKRLRYRKKHMYECVCERMNEVQVLVLSVKGPTLLTLSLQACFFKKKKTYNINMRDPGIHSLFETA